MVQERTKKNVLSNHFRLRFNIIIVLTECNNNNSNVETRDFNNDAKFIQVDIYTKHIRNIMQNVIRKKEDEI